MELHQWKRDVKEELGLISALAVSHLNWLMRAN